MMNNKKAESMLDIKWSDAGKDQIIAFFKRNDQAVYGARDGECVGFIDPVQHLNNHGFLPDIGDFNAKAFTVAYLDRSQIPNLRSAISQNAIATEQKTDTKILIDPDLIKDYPTKTDQLIQPISLVKAPTILKAVKLDMAQESLSKDLNAIASGSATYGSGGTYALRSAAYADLTTFTGNITFTRIAATTETAVSTFNVGMTGNNFVDNGANIASIHSLDGHGVNIVGTGATGTSIFSIYNDIFTHDSTAITGSSYLLRLPDANTSRTFNFYNLRYDGNNAENLSGIIKISANNVMNLWNFIVKNYKGASRVGLYIFAPNASDKHENGIIDNCTTGVNGNNTTHTIRSCYLINNTANYANNTNSTSVSCGTDAASVGAATNTSAAVNKDESSELVNTTMTDLSNGYACSLSGTIRTLGSTPAITTNTTDIFGRSRISPYEIGVGKQIPLVSKSRSRINMISGISL